jgi:hypothetical protein
MQQYMQNGVLNVILGTIKIPVTHVFNAPRGHTVRAVYMNAVRQMTELSPALRGNHVISVEIIKAILQKTAQHLCHQMQAHTK